MKQPAFTAKFLKRRTEIKDVKRNGFFAFVLFSLFACLSLTTHAQRIAVLSPLQTPYSQAVTEKLSTELAKHQKVLEGSLSSSIFQGFSFEAPYNLSKEEAKNVSSALGCNFLLILKSESLRRVSLSKPEYYESYLSVYLISSRTGRLSFWTIKTFEAADAASAGDKLLSSLPALANEISAKAVEIKQNELNEAVPPQVEELPDENSPDIKKFRSPIPYKRIRPPYTALANLYGITATVDALIDLDEAGNITRAEIVRWAGYELDESVLKTIREMQWRPASRDGKPLPIRVLLRYNFKKIEKEQ